MLVVVVVGEIGGCLCDVVGGLEWGWSGGRDFTLEAAVDGRCPAFVRRRLGTHRRVAAQSSIHGELRRERTISSRGTVLVLFLSILFC